VTERGRNSVGGWTRRPRGPRSYSRDRRGNRAEEPEPDTGDRADRMDVMHVSTASCRSQHPWTENENLSVALAEQGHKKNRSFRDGPRQGTVLAFKLG